MRGAPARYLDLSGAVGAQRGCVRLDEPLLVFGVHKCGSTMIHSMMGQLCALARWPRLNVPALATEQGLESEDWDDDEGLLPLFRKHWIFYGFRALPPVLLRPGSGIRDRKFVLLVRDPRDALVSQYFSFGGRHVSHVLPEHRKERVLSELRKTAHLEIDDYALHAARPLHAKLVEYRDALDFSRGLLLHYEDVYFDKLGALRRICDYFGLDAEPGVLEEVARANDVRPVREDVTRHIRKGAPGDHAEKLKPETIRELNSLFAEVAAAYGYTLSGR